MNKILVFKEGQLLKLCTGIGILLAIIIVGSFFIGAIVTCENGGGQLSRLTCRNIEVTGVCEFGDTYYIEPSEGDLNWSLT